MFSCGLLDKCNILIKHQKLYVKVPRKYHNVDLKSILKDFLKSNFILQKDGSMAKY